MSDSSDAEDADEAETAAEPGVDNPYVWSPPTEFEASEDLDRETAERQVDHLREAIRYHDRRYYDEADPIIEDRVYDALFSRLQELEGAFDLVTEDSPTQRVSGEPLDELATVEHVAPMRSVDSSGEASEVREFDERVRRRLDAADWEGDIEVRL